MLRSCAIILPIIHSISLSLSPSHKQAYVEPDVVLLDHFVMCNLIEQYEELQCWHWQ